MNAITEISTNINKYMFLTLTNRVFIITHTLPEIIANH